MTDLHGAQLNMIPSFLGDMRQALNNLQSTYEGFGYVNSDNVFKVLILAIIYTLVKYIEHKTPELLLLI